MARARLVDVQQTAVIFDEPVAVIHEPEWSKSSNTTKLKEVPFHQWKVVRDRFGYDVYPSSLWTQGMPQYDFFMLMFPDDQLSVRIEQLHLKGWHANVTKGELLKSFGVLILSTWFELKSRAELWSTTQHSNYRPVVSFILTGMTRNHCDTLFTNVRWSDQPEEQPAVMPSETYRCGSWYQTSFEVLIPIEPQCLSHQIMVCVDKSMAHWYGMGG